VHSLVISLIALAGFDHRFGGGEAGSLSLSFQEIASYAVLYLLVLHLLLFRREGILSTISRDIVVRVVAGYAVWLLLGAAANGLFFGNLDALHGLKDSVPGLVLFAAMVAWVDSEAKLRHVHVGLSITLVLLGLLAISQFAWGGPYLNRLDPNAVFKLDYRGVSLVQHPVVGTLGSPNTNAVFLMPLALITIGRLAEELREPEPTRGWEWLALGAVVCCVAVVMTQAKIATTLGAIGLVLAVITIHRKIRATPARAGLLFGGLLAAACVSVAILTQFAGSLPETFSMGTLVERASLDQAAFALIQERPATAILGGGIGSFSDQTGGVLGIHNEYLRQCVQAGLPAGLLFVGALFSGMLRRQPHWTYLLPLVVLGLLFLTESATGNQLQSMVFLTLGLNVASARIQRERPA